jgi:hypothetical protein
MFNSSRPITQTLLQIVFLVSCLGLCSMVAAAQSETAQSEPEERIFEDKIPKHLPIKFKIKNAAKAKDLKNRKWLRDLEVEVTNTGDRPIYHFIILADMPEVISPMGISYGYPLVYGRRALRGTLNNATPEDVPLEPGESCILKAPEQDWRGWESGTASGEHVDPKKVRLIFAGLSFGDGTGFHAGDGQPYPRKVAR